MEYLQTSILTHLASADHVTEENIGCEAINSLKEADTLTVGLDRSENDAITVYSLETDVCLPVAVKASMVKQVYIKTNHHFLRLEQIHNNLGTLKSNAFLSVHALSGCYMTGMFFCKIEGKVQ